MLAKLGEALSKFVSKYLPDTIVLAIFLTVVAYFLGIVVMGESPLQMLVHWGGSIWNMLAYTMQIAMVLLTGIVFANTKPIQVGLKALASPIRSPRMGILMAAVVGILACYLSWGFGLIVSALFAKEISRKVDGVHFPLVCAAGYTGLATWHAGFSGSSLLVTATPGHFLEDVIGVIPMSQTQFSPLALTVFLVFLVSIPIIMMLMHPAPEKTIVFKDEEAPATQEKVDKSGMAWAERVDNNRIISLILGVPMFIYVVYYFTVLGGGLTLDSLNLIFLSLGIIFTESPRKYVDVCVQAGKNTANVLVQYPLYAGIMGMMTASGFATLISDAIVANATVTTLPLLTFISAGVLNMFVPGGGAQWVVQGPIMMPAAIQMGASVEATIIAFAWGDGWTNMLQPFWALPLLSVAGLNVRDIMGYCIVILVWMFVVFSVLSFIL